MVTCGPWLIASSRDGGLEWRDLDSFALRWERGVDANDPEYVSSLHGIDSRSFVAELGWGGRHRIEIVDAETGLLSRSVRAEGRLIGAVDRRVLVRSDDELTAHAVDSDAIEWRVSLAQSDVVVPTANGCWIQRAREVSRVDSAGRLLDVVTVDEGAMLVGGSDETLFVRSG
jgi:hypothetical protein